MATTQPTSSTTSCDCGRAATETILMYGEVPTLVCQDCADAFALTCAYCDRVRESVTATTPGDPGGDLCAECRAHLNGIDLTGLGDDTGHYDED